jgi:hypothetical protein
MVFDATNLKLMNKIKGLVKTDKRFKDVSINFLENQRVEIDSILSQ